MNNYKDVLLTIFCILILMRTVGVTRKKDAFMADMGIEPTTFALLARRSNQLS